MSEYKPVVEEILHDTGPGCPYVSDPIDTFVYGALLPAITQVVNIRQAQKEALNDET